jgi:LGFP repeat-containing protein
MRFRILVAILATLVTGTVTPFLASHARGTDESASEQEFHVHETPETQLELQAPEVADPDVNATFTGSLIRDGEPAVEEWVDLMVDGEDMTHAITDSNGNFSMETEMWEAPIHTVQAIASRGSDIEIEGAILTVAVRPVSPDLWGTTVGDESGENTPAVQGWAREETTVNLFTDVACEFEPVTTATVEELAAGIALPVADNSTTKIYANVTNERGLTSDCSEPITYEEDSEGPVVENIEVTPVEDSVEVSWTPPTDETGEPEAVTAEVCVADSVFTSADACFSASEAQVVEAEPATTTTTITNLEPLHTYTVATRFTDKVGNDASFLLGNFLLTRDSAVEAINARYAALGGANGLLGVPTSDVYQTDNRVGYYQNFRYGTIYYSTASGAHELHGDIREKFKALGGTWWGFPTTDETVTPDRRGRYNHFTGGKSIYWTPEWRAHTVEGPVHDKWESLGFEAGFGYPVTDTLATSNGRGKYNFFEGGHAIYWSPETNAHSLYSTIFTKWASLNYENGLLGFPATDQTRTPDGQGEFVHFQGGSIYYSANSGTREIHGPIWDKWMAAGAERGYGYPVTDTTSLPNGGLYSHFQDGRSIYYSPQTGAHLVYGEIRNKWASMGWERGALGYPTSDELSVGDVRVSRFQGGSLAWNGYQAMYVRKVPVVAVLVSDDDGSRAPTVSNTRFSWLIKFNSTILLKAGVQLTWNPADIRTYRNTGTNNLTNDSTTDDVNVWMEQNFPNHLGIFFHQAGAFGREDLRFVFLDSMGGPGTDALAHEVGHWLDLDHTFIDPTNTVGKGEITDSDPKVVAAAGGPGGEWRVDGDGLSDTPPDPSAKYVRSNRPSWICEGAFRVWSPAGWSLTFDPQRNNVMSYYGECGTRNVLTPMQIARMRNAAKGWMMTDWRF